MLSAMEFLILVVISFCFILFNMFYFIDLVSLYKKDVCSK